MNPKNRYLLCLLIFCFLSFTKGVGLTNSYFYDKESLGNGSVGAGDWTDPSSEITSLTGSGEISGATNLTNFTVHYEASDNAIDHVELWYSFNLDQWQYFGYDVPNSPGSFIFTSPQGDGLYRFLTVAIDQAGNVEDRDGNGNDDNADNTELNLAAAFLGSGLYQIQVDTETPHSVLSLDKFGNKSGEGNRFAVNELTGNGNFEDTNDAERGWTLGGDGEHVPVDNTALVGIADVKAGNKSGMIGWFNSDPTGDGIDYAYQVVPIPNTPSTLSFWYRVISDDTVDYDWFEAKIVDDNDISLSETILKTGSGEILGWTADSLWREATHSLSAWLGKTVRLTFDLVNHDVVGSPEKTFALVDDVRVTNSDNFITTNRPIDIDSYDASGSGIDKTYYRVDGGSWQEYTGAFELKDEGVGSGATASVDYYSVDVAGNTEVSKNLLLTTDNTKAYFGVVLDRFMADPNGADDAAKPSGERVRLHNNSSSDIDVAGWILYDNDDSHPLSITSLNTDTGNTIVPHGGNLIIYLDGVYSGGWLDNGGDTIRLYNGVIVSGGVLIDSFTYPSSIRGKLWKRSPAGTGGWADPDEEVEIIIDRVEEGKVKLIIENLTESAEGINYELIYLSNGLEKGISGLIISEGEVDDGVFEKDFVLGTCSSGICLYNQVDENKVRVRLTILDGNDSIVIEKETIL